MENSRDLCFRKIPLQQCEQQITGGQDGVRRIGGTKGEDAGGSEGVMMRPAREGWGSRGRCTVRGLLQVRLDRSWYMDGFGG